MTTRSTRLYRRRTMSIGKATPAPELAEGSCADPSADPEAWFDPELRALAKAICACCPVAAKCADWGRRNATHGVWGGVVLDREVAA